MLDSRLRGNDEMGAGMTPGEPVGAAAGEGKKKKDDDVIDAEFEVKE